MSEVQMSKEELRPIVEAWNGAYNFSKVIGVRERTIYRWLAEGVKSGPAANLIRTLEAKGK